MNAISSATDTERYARCIKASRSMRPDIDQDVVRTGSFDRSDKFLPGCASLARESGTLSDKKKRYVCQVHGRAHPKAFCLVECFINARVLEECELSHSVSGEMRLQEWTSTLERRGS